jgi:uncharacterized membrane protein (DUF106 family)
MSTTFPIILATVNILGAIIVQILVAAIISWISRLSTNRLHKQCIQDMAIQLGTVVEEVNQNKYKAEVIKIQAERYNRDLFKNRLSDLCGLLMNCLTWLSQIIFIFIVLGTSYYTLTNNFSGSGFVWVGVLWSFTFWIVNVLIYFICRFATGRTPGEAKNGRALIASFLDQGFISRSEPSLASSSFIK